MSRILIDVALNLIHHPDLSLRIAIARSEQTSPKALYLMSNDPNEAVVVAVAGNRSTPRLILQRLASHPHEDVRQMLVFNPNTPNKVLQLLSEDSNPYTSRRSKELLEARASC